MIAPAHPFSVVRARIRGGDSWAEWYGWDYSAAKISENTNVFIAANTMKGSPHYVWTPSSSTTVDVRPDTLEAASAQLMSMV